MESLFISEETWETYAEIIACEDIQDATVDLDEDLLMSDSINLNEIKI